MTTEEIYTICKLIFPNKQVQFNGYDVIISWNYMGIFRRIWIEQHYDYILIDSVGRLPSWFVDKVNYSYTAGKGRIFKGFKDSD